MKNRVWLRAFALGLMLLTTGCAQQLFYAPDHVVYDNPDKEGLAYDNVMFPSADGTRLSGWFIPAAGYTDPRQAKGTVIHFHGNAENMTSHWQLMQWLPRRGYNLFVFDYRGYGKSEGTPSARGVFEDSNSALDYVRQRPDVDPQRLILLGQSLGGANAISVLGSGNREGVQAIVIEATFYSYSAIANDKVVGGGLLVDNAYSPDRFVEKLAPTPFLLLHGTDDALIPYRHAVMLIEKAQEPKRLVAIPGGRHIEAFSARFGRIYQDAVCNFLDAIMAFREPVRTLSKRP